MLQLKNRLFQTFLIALSLLAQACSTPKKATLQESLATILSSPEFVEIKPSAQISIELKYATADNFMGKNLYGEFTRAFLHQDAAKSLTQAAQTLQKNHPRWKLHIYDALRPRSIQYQMWEKVSGTPDAQYVADPNLGSIHNYGLAVDLTIVDEKGKPIDMGTPYDSFDRLAQPQLEDEFLKEGKLTIRQVENRKILRTVMEGAGFKQLPHEWWHYDRYPRTEAKARFKIVE